MASQRRLLTVFGYTREFVNEHSIKVPNDVIQIMILFYGKEYKIYAKGKNMNDEWGLGSLSQLENQYTELKDMSKLIQQPNDIFYAGCGK